MKLVYQFPGDSDATIAEIGGKGLSLLQGSQAGFPIPPGFVITVDFFKPWLLKLKKSQAWQAFVHVRERGEDRELQIACDALKRAVARYTFSDEQKTTLTTALAAYPANSLFAVRSSSPHEDLEGASFAGGYETVLGVTAETIQSAVRHCFQSCLDYRVVIYLRQNGFGATDPQIAVVIQQQIASDISGVGFSLNPITNHYDEAVFNANWGLGETVVSGVVTPDAFIVDKIREHVALATIGSKETSVWLRPDGGTQEKKRYRSTDRTLSDAQLIKLTQLIKQVETHYGKPMDIEWAYAQSDLYLLQARPITTYIPLAPEMITAPGEKKRLYFDVTVTAQAMTQPLSIAGTSMFRRLLQVIGRIVWLRDISKDLQTSLPWISDGRIFVNVSNGFVLAGKKKILEVVPEIDALAASAIRELDEDEYISNTPRIRLLPLGLLLRAPGILLMIFRAKRNPMAVHQWVQQEIRRFENEAQDLARKDMPIGELTEVLLRKMFFQVFRRTVPLTFAARRTLGTMQRLVGDVATKLEVAVPNNVTTEMGLSLAAVAATIPETIDATQLRERIASRNLSSEFEQAWNQFLERYGHRAPAEIDVASPRYRDDSNVLINLLVGMKRAGSEDPRVVFERNQRERQALFESLHQKLISKNRNAAAVFANEYRFFETFGGYRETHKAYLVFVVTIIRQKMLAAGQTFVTAKRLDMPEQVFDLTIDQIDAALHDTSIDLRSLAQKNTVFIKRLARISRPPPLIDSRGFIPSPPRAPVKPGEHIGVGVSTGTIQGRIKVLHTPDEKPLLKGEILVARATDPGWTPLFVNAGGIILEIGGALQHGALVAREYGIPCVAGVEHATSLWPDGTLVEVNGSDGSIRVV